MGRAVAGDVAAGEELGAGERPWGSTVDAEAERRTLALPAILSPVHFPAKLLPKPTPANLRRFAETPVVRRAINVIKDRIASMDWQVRLRRDAFPGDHPESRPGKRRCGGRWKSLTRWTAFAP